MKRAIPSLYAEYGRYIDEFRAIPYHIDCLKPVERRLLFTLFQVAKKLTKSARVIGDAIGKYHPHGDQSAYGTLVGLVRRGFATGQGNWGATGFEDTDPAAYRYCITLDSKIKLRNSIISIGKLLNNSNGEDINQNIISFDNTFNNASKVFDCGLDEVYSVNINYNYSIEGNDKHPLLILNSDLNFQWKTISELNKGDYCILQHTWEDIPFSNNNIAVILGCLVSEGWYTDYSKIGFNNTNFDFCTIYEKALLNEFDSIHISKTNSKLKSGKVLYSYECCQPTFCKQIESYGFIKGYSQDRCIPEYVWNQTQSFHKQFLSCLFEGDGSIVKGKRNSIILSYTSSSYQLLKDVQLMLWMSFGIISKLSISENKVLIIGIDNINKFYNRIGFISDKQTKLKSIINSVNINSNSKCEYIPHLRDYILRKYGKKLTYKQKKWLNRNKFTTFRTLSKHWDKLLTFIDNDDINLFKRLSSGSYVFLPIKSIKYEGIKPIASIRVDSNCHSFNANGFINHNTEVSSNQIVNEIAFEFIKYIPHHDPENLSYKQPKFLPCPIPIGLVGDGFIQGISFNTTKIPRYSLQDLINRLIYLFKHQVNPKTPPVIIKPSFPGCTVYEGTHGAYETILTQGTGKVIVVPNYTIEKDQIKIFAKPALGFSSLKSNADDPKKPDQRKFDNIDMSQKENIEVWVQPQIGNVDQEFVNLIHHLLTHNINMLCNVVYDDGTVNLSSIDSLLLGSYNKWVDAYQLKLTQEKQGLIERIYELQVIAVIRNIIQDNGNAVKSAEDVVNIYNTNKKYQNEKIGAEAIREIVAKHRIKTLLEHSTNTATVQHKLSIIDNQLSNMAQTAFARLNEIFPNIAK